MSCGRIKVKRGLAFQLFLVQMAIKRFFITMWYLKRMRNAFNDHEHKFVNYLYKKYGSMQRNISLWKKKHWCQWTFKIIILYLSRLNKLPFTKTDMWQPSQYNTINIIEEV